MTEGELLIEKRKYPRWLCSLNIKYKILSDDKLGKFKDIFQKSKEVRTKDVSAGGCLLIVNERVNIGSKLLMDVYFPSTDSDVKIFAEVVRVIEREEEGKKKYFIGVKFIDIITESDEIMEEILNQKQNLMKRSNLTKEDVFKLAKLDYFLRLINAELIERRQ